MAKRKPLETSEELVSAFADLFDAVEFETPEEIDAVLLEAGYDPNEIAARMRAVAVQTIAESPLNWRNQTDALEEERIRLASLPSALLPSREDLIAGIESILARLPTVRRRTVMAYHRNLDEATNEDLASLLAELQYLEARQGKPLDKDEG